MLLKFKNHIIPLLFCFLLVSCGGKKWNENPLNQMKEKYSDAYMYTVLVTDMDVKDNKYYHKYDVIVTQKVDSDPEAFKTDWVEVSEPFFIRHEGNLGMEILTKDENGVINEIPSPPGFTNYIGNEKYGKWEGTGDNRTWSFFTQYLFMRSMLGFVYGPVYYAPYNHYRTNYRYNRPFYGWQSRSTTYNHYGTKSSKLKSTRPDFYKRKVSKGNFRTRYQSYTSSSSRGGGGFGK